MKTLDATSFVSTRTRTTAGHAATLEATERRIAPLLARLPVTRVYDVTPLDVLGIPVWCAVTPLAADLTVHAGKGASPRAARISAIMEGIERVTAERVPAHRVRTASYQALAAAGNAVDPACFDLPFETSYRPDREISWIEGYDLGRQEPVHVPLDLVISPATEGVCTGVETNGLASGNTLTEAALHALYEIIERDAEAHARFYDLYHDTQRQVSAVRMIDISTFPEATQPFLQQMTNEDLELRARDLKTDIGVPVIAVYAIDAAFPGSEGQPIAFAGFGCDLRPARAALRAVTEAAQSHTGVMLGARDSFESEGGDVTERAAMALRRTEVLYPDRVQPFEVSEQHSEDLREDLMTVVGRLRAAGLSRCIVVDLTREDLGIPVVRVLVPGLATPYGDSARRPARRLLQTVVG